MSSEQLHIRLSAISRAPALGFLVPTMRCRLVSGTQSSLGSFPHPGGRLSWAGSRGGWGPPPGPDPDPCTGWAWPALGRVRCGLQPSAEQNRLRQRTHPLINSPSFQARPSTWKDSFAKKQAVALARRGQVSTCWGTLLGSGWRGQPGPAGRHRAVALVCSLLWRKPRA